MALFNSRNIIRQKTIDNGKTAYTILSNTVVDQTTNEFIYVGKYRTYEGKVSKKEKEIHLVDDYYCQTIVLPFTSKTHEFVAHLSYI